MKTVTLILTLLLTGAGASAQSDWRAKLAAELPLLGHRNWIAVVDSAYPLQTSPGVETVETGEDQVTVLREVLAKLAAAPHVTPLIFLDAELPFVPEKEAKGADAYRAALQSLLERKKPTYLPHEQIIANLDAAGKTFHVLLLKTTLTVPYTSVFLQLDCAYWGSGSEQRLRTAMQAAQTKSR